MISSKHFISTIALTLLAFAPFASQAATITFSPTKITVHAGEIFSVGIGIHSPDVKAYTIKMDGTFTPKILRFSGWTFGDLWNVLRQPGYDSIDDKLGTFIRTAGYGGGFTGDIHYANARFIGNSVGSGTITVSPSSFILDSTSQNIYSGANQVAVTVLPAVVAPAPAPSAVVAPVPVVTKPVEVTPVVPPKPVSKPPATIAPLFDVSAQVLSSQKTSSFLKYGILLLIGGIICGFILVMILERRKRKQILAQANKKDV